MPNSASDPALETLLHFAAESASAVAAAAGGTLFLNARGAAALRALGLSGLRCEQAFRPEFDALQAAGLDATAEVEASARFAQVLLLPPRQREAARALYARALGQLAPGGRLLVCQRNDEGARSCEADLRELVEPVQVQSKNRCRLLVIEGAARIDEACRQRWSQLDAPCPILDGDLLSRPGVFAWDRIDPASRLLVEQWPADMAGRAADLGGGWGYLSVELLRRCPAIRSLDVFEADARALALAERNLRPLAGTRELRLHWHDVTRGLPGRYELILSNPPFHAQTAHDRPDIGRAFIERAADALAPGGTLWLVANRHLPYESLLAERFDGVHTLIQRDGFKVIRASAPRSGNPP